MITFIFDILHSIVRPLCFQTHELNVYILANCFSYTKAFTLYLIFRVLWLFNMTCSSTFVLISSQDQSANRLPLDASTYIDNPVVALCLMYKSTL